jgi:hypothetical protein
MSATAYRQALQTSQSRLVKLVIVLPGFATPLLAYPAVAANDPLPAWIDTGSEKAILAFVEKVAKEDEKGRTMTSSGGSSIPNRDMSIEVDETHSNAASSE